MQSYKSHIRRKLHNSIRSCDRWSAGDLLYDVHAVPESAGHEQLRTGDCISAFLVQMRQFREITEELYLDVAAFASAGVRMQERKNSFPFFGECAVNESVTGGYGLSCPCALVVQARMFRSGWEGSAIGFF